METGAFVSLRATASLRPTEIADGFPIHGCLTRAPGRVRPPFGLQTVAQITDLNLQPVELVDNFGTGWRETRIVGHARSFPSAASPVAAGSEVHADLTGDNAGRLLGCDA